MVFWKGLMLLRFAALIPAIMIHEIAHARLHDELPEERL